METKCVCLILKNFAFSFRQVVCKPIMEGPIKDDEDRHTNRTIPVECDICHKTIKNKYELQRHKKNRHSEKRTEHQCPDCSYACPLPSDLKRHILRVHKGEKPIKCPWPDCEKTFSEKGNMTTILEHFIDRLEATKTY